MTFRSAAWMLIVAAVACTPARAANMFGDIYGGVSLPVDQTVKSTTEAGGLEARFYDSGHAHDGPTVGGRIGVMTEGQIQFGAALDVSWIPIEYDTADLSLVPISALLIVNFPIAGRHQEKQGDFQINGYGAIGPSLALGILDVPETSPFHSFDFDPDVSPGLDLRAGLELDFSGPFKVFVEYRFFYTGFKFEDSATVFGGAVRERFELDAMVNAINFGIRF